MKKGIFLLMAVLVFLGFSMVKSNNTSGSKAAKKEFEIKSGSVYYLDKKVKSLDAATFRILNKYYAEDKNGVYFYDDLKIETENPVIKTSDSVLSETEYLVFEEYIFYKGNFYMSGRLIGESHGNKFDFDKNTLKITGIQPVEGEIPCGGKDWSGSCSIIHRDLIFSDKDGVYITIEHMDIWKFNGIDPETFEKTGDSQYKDKNGSYTMEELWGRAVQNWRKIK